MEMFAADMGLTSATSLAFCRASFWLVASSISSSSWCRESRQIRACIMSQQQPELPRHGSNVTVAAVLQECWKLVKDKAELPNFFQGPLGMALVPTTAGQDEKCKVWATAHCIFTKNTFPSPSFLTSLGLFLSLKIQVGDYGWAGRDLITNVTFRRGRSPIYLCLAHVKHSKVLTKWPLANGTFPLQ